jgi:hypothetical protein
MDFALRISRDRIPWNHGVQAEVEYCGYNMLIGDTNAPRTCLATVK